jgi:hypothetical protein
MINRMSVSYHKYGPVAQAGGIAKLESAGARVAMYLETGNTEWLIDAANFLMMEFMYPLHPEAHYRPTNSSEAIGRMDVRGRKTGEKHNLDVED